MQLNLFWELFLPVCQAVACGLVLGSVLQAVLYGVEDWFYRSPGSAAARASIVNKAAPQPTDRTPARTASANQAIGRRPVGVGSQA
jgi:hypothetical protein